MGGQDLDAADDLRYQLLDLIAHELGLDVELQGKRLIVHAQPSPLVVLVTVSRDDTSRPRHRPGSLSRPLVNADETRKR